MESEFAAMSVSIGASAAGARAYTATASQGLLYMMEAVHNASGLELPIVMTLANRAIGAPINIWNDHSDAMAASDAGWIQLFAETNQEAVDLHVLAFRLAEELSLPVMVCMDGFILTHAVEQVDLPEQAQVDAYLPPYSPRQFLDPADPVSIGAMVGPEAFEEVKVLAHLRQLDALERIPELAAEFEVVFGRPSAGLVSSYRTEDAETIVVALGSVLGTIEDAVDERRRTGDRVGVVGITTFRPFPVEAVRRALAGARRVVVLEKAFRPGGGGLLSGDVTLALRDAGVAVHTVVAGLGGRPITRRGIESVLGSADTRRARRAELPRPRQRRRRARAGPDPVVGPHRTAGCRHSPPPATTRGRPRRRVAMTGTPVRFYQVGSYAAGNRLVDGGRPDRAVRRHADERPRLGAPGLPGLW